MRKAKAKGANVLWLPMANSYPDQADADSERSHSKAADVAGQSATLQALFELERKVPYLVTTGTPLMVSWMVTAPPGPV